MSEKCDHALGIVWEVDHFFIVYKTDSFYKKEEIDRQFKFCPDCGEKLEVKDANSTPTI